MPSNDERREVAASLRETQIENIGPIYSAHLGDAIGECARVVSGHEELVTRALSRLANLIEPEERTCEITRPNCSDFRWRCGICGEQFSTCDKPNFCPNCGARVKEAE